MVTELALPLRRHLNRYIPFSGVHLHFLYPLETGYASTIWHQPYDYNHAPVCLWSSRGDSYIIKHSATCHSTDQW
jgi:hypothetical protein